MRSDVQKMRAGNIRIKDPDNKADWAKNQQSIDTVAKWLAFSVATPPINGEPLPRDDKSIPAMKTMDDLMDNVVSYTNLGGGATTLGKLSVEQVEYGMIFGKALADAVKIVRQNSFRPIERINAVRILAIAARMPCPDLADSFIEIISNKEINDGEKLYAFQGIKNLMEQTDNVDASKHVIRDVNQLAKLATALSDYITRNREVKDEREKAVIEFTRRHAIAALAAFRDGVYRKPNRDLIYRPSWTLMRVIGGDPTVSPGFTGLEKAEAIIGFCQMRNDVDMNLDVAAYMIAVAPLPTSAGGATLGGLVEFARTANEDILRANREKTLPSAHWKITAARMSLSMAQWRESAKSLPKNRYPENVVSLATLGIAMLTLIEKEGGGASTGAEVQSITTWAGNNAPKAWAEMQVAQLYKDDAKSVLPFAAPAKKASDPKLTTPAPIPTPPSTKGPDPKEVNPKKDSNLPKKH